MIFSSTCFLFPLLLIRSSLYDSFPHLLYLLYHLSHFGSALSGQANKNIPYMLRLIGKEGIRKWATMNDGFD